MEKDKIVMLSQCRRRRCRWSQKKKEKKVETNCRQSTDYKSIFFLKKNCWNNWSPLMWSRAPSSGYCNLNWHIYTAIHAITHPLFLKIYLFIYLSAYIKPDFTDLIKIVNLSESWLASSPAHHQQKKKNQNEKEKKTNLIPNLCTKSSPPSTIMIKRWRIGVSLKKQLG